MITEKFHQGEQPHSLLGFGTMRFPTLPSGEVDEVQTKELFEAALAGGINYIDTGYSYHDGASEGVIKRVLADHPRHSYLLADKLPMWCMKEQPDMERIFNEQLEKCGVDYFDYYLVHALNKERVKTMQRLGILDFLKAQQARGKVRHLGFSFHDDLDCLREILGLYDWEFCQLQLNYADWNRFKARELYELAEERGVPVIVMEPVRGGFLANPPAQVVRLLQEANPGRSMASWALRFVASLPGVKLVLSGMSTLEQMQDNLSTFSGPIVRLTDEEQRVIAQAMDILDSINNVPCTGCRYCMPCPNGVRIPDIFTLYNSVALLGQKANDYDELPPEARAAACINCGVCVSLCPQQIDIPERLKEADACLIK